MENFAQDHKAKYPTDNTNAQELMLHPILRCILQMMNFHLRERDCEKAIPTLQFSFDDKSTLAKLGHSMMAIDIVH